MCGLPFSGPSSIMGQKIIDQTPEIWGKTFSTNERDG
jgi:hypothetical protein